MYANLSRWAMPAAPQKKACCSDCAAKSGGGLGFVAVPSSGPGLGVWALVGIVGAAVLAARLLLPAQAFVEVSRPPQKRRRRK
jgi:hypothetical protein